MSRGTGTTASGPLAGLRVVEFAGIGPGPFACMLLSDLGAEVIRIDRPGVKLGDPRDIVGRGRTTVLLDLKLEADVETALELLAEADVLVEGFRPGVMERMGLGPDVVAQRNPRLVYGRMTGWGQDGPLAQSAAHDINFVAIGGALDAIGSKNGAPVPPLNLVGDYGGGSLYLVVGILSAIFESQRSGRGQVVDAAICDGVVSLMSLFHTQYARGQFREQRGTNVIDGGAPYYTVYETSDSKYVSLGPIEPKFFELLCEMVGIPADLKNAQNDRARWPELRAAFAEVFRTRTRDEWTNYLGGTDVCFAPVLTLQESITFPHLENRKTFVDVAGLKQPAPAPRFSRTPGEIRGPAPASASTVQEVLQGWRSSQVQI